MKHQSFAKLLVAAIPDYLYMQANNIVSFSIALFKRNVYHFSVQKNNFTL